MPVIIFPISDDVWNFLNKKGEPTEVVKRIVESVWEMDGVSKEGDTSLIHGTPDDMIIGMLLQACGDDAGNIDNHCMSAWEDACKYLHKKGLVQKINDRMYKIDEEAYWKRVLG